jgi:NAD(P)-dependent dehydrogenase (short-subunit alcohol dehydrogenase family)
VSSSAHKRGNIDFTDLNWEKRKYNAWQAYSDSKIANLYFTYGLAERIGKSGSETLAVAAHPGWTATDLQRHAVYVRVLNKFFAQNIEMGALPTLYAAVTEDVNNADYFGPSGFLEMKGYPKKVDSNALSQDANIAQRLWSVSEELTGIKYRLKG